MTDPADPPMIAYAAPGLPRRPPVDWAGMARQTAFAVGVSFLAGGLCAAVIHDVNQDPSPGFIGVGAGLVALTMPWPGRIGRRRGPS